MTDLFTPHILEERTNQLRVHQYENNSDSQKILDEFRNEFSHDTKLLLHILLGGATVTNFWLIQNHISNSPTRRISDLKQSGITVSKEMRLCEGSKRKEMHYWLELAEIQRVKQNYYL